MKKNKIVAIVAVCLLFCAIIAYIELIKIPRDRAIKEYDAALEIVEEKNSVLESEITALQSLVDSGEKPYKNEILKLAKKRDSKRKR